MSRCGQPKLRIRLRIDLEGAAELVELVDVGGAHVRGQRRKNLVGRDVQYLGLDPVYFDIVLRHRRTEWRADALQRALRLPIGDHRIDNGLQFAEIRIAVAQLDLHGKAGGVADALDRRRRHHQNPRLLDHRQFFVQPDKQRAQVLARAACAPLLQDQIGDTGIGKTGRAVERRYAGNGDDLIDARRLAGYFADPVEHALGTVQRRAVGQLHGDQQIALVLDRNKTGRHPRQAITGNPDQDQRRDDGSIAVRDHAGDQAGISPLDPVIDGVKTAVEKIALLRRRPAGAATARTASASASRH